MSKEEMSEKEVLESELERDGIPLPSVSSREDILSDSQAGRVGGVFSVGERIEAIKEDHEREEVKFRNWMEAFAAAGTTLKEFKERIKKEASDSRITIKEREYALKYVQRCVDLIQKLFNDADAKRLQSDGAKQAMDLAIKTIKRIYDDEREKLRRMEEYLVAPGDSAKERIRNRPTGLNPGVPLDEMKVETEAHESPTKGTRNKPKRKRKVKSKKPEKD